MGKDVDAYYKRMVDEVYSKQKWAIDETGMQDLYETILFNFHYEFCHNGHAYFITFDTNEEKKEVWVIYDRDFSDPQIAYKSDWDIEKRVDYKDLPSLIFEFELKNDGRTIAEYCYDYWNQPRKLIPEPIDYKYKRKML